MKMMRLTTMPSSSKVRFSVSIARSMSVERS